MSRAETERGARDVHRARDFPVRPVGDGSGGGPVGEFSARPCIEGNARSFTDSYRTHTVARNVRWRAGSNLSGWPADSLARVTQENLMTAK